MVHRGCAVLVVFVFAFASASAQDKTTPAKDTASSAVPSPSKPPVHKAPARKPKPGPGQTDPTGTLGAVHSSPIMETAEERAEEKAVKHHQDPRKAVEKVQQKDHPPPR
jgi:hypothetical protein